MNDEEQHDGMALTRGRAHAINAGPDPTEDMSDDFTRYTALQFAVETAYTTDPSKRQPTASDIAAAAETFRRFLTGEAQSGAVVSLKRDAEYGEAIARNEDAQASAGHPISTLMAAISDAGLPATVQVLAAICADFADTTSESNFWGAEADMFSVASARYAGRVLPCIDFDRPQEARTELVAKTKKPAWP